MNKPAYAGAISDSLLAIDHIEFIVVVETLRDISRFQTQRDYRSFPNVLAGVWTVPYTLQPLGLGIGVGLGMLTFSMSCADRYLSLIHR